MWWYKSYLSETLRLAEKDRIKVIPNIFNSGAPDLSWFGILYPEHQRLRDIGGLFGYNSYPVREGMNLCSNDDYATWTTFRYERFSLPGGLGIYVAEFARSWGEMEPDFNDVECYVKRVDGDFRVITKWYVATPLYPWEMATIRGKLNQLADVYIKALSF